MEFSLATVVAVLETAALIAALCFMTCSIREKKRTPAHKALQKKISICLFAYLALHVIRNYVL